MSTSLDPTPRPVDATAAPSESFPPPTAPLPNGTPPDGFRPAPQSERKHSVGHIIAIVIGCFMLLPGIGLAVGGGGLAIGQAVATDDDGYFRFTLDPVQTDGVAIVSDDAWLDIDDADWPWVLDWMNLDIRLRVDGTLPTDEVFVGIARTADVERYLADVAYSQVIDLDDHSPEYDLVGGEGRLIAPPAEQDFWASSAVGDGEQTMTWEARGGRWTIVVMNADGSPDVNADIEIGAKSDAITPIAVTLLVGGAILLLVATTLIVVGIRGRRPAPAPTATPLVIDDRPPTDA